MQKIAIIQISKEGEENALLLQRELKAKIREKRAPTLLP